MSFGALVGAGAFAAFVFRRERRLALAAAAYAAAAVELAIPGQATPPDRGAVVEAL
jgi:hypothetical protein